MRLVFNLAPRYDFFKSELLKTPYFEDNILCHFTASFAAVCFLTSSLLSSKMLMRGMRQGTVATTVCSPADVLKSRIMNASGPGSSVRFFMSIHPDLLTITLFQFYAVNTRRDPSIARERGPNVYVQGLASRMDASPTNDDSHFPDTRAAETFGRLATGVIVRAPHSRVA